MSDNPEKSRRKELRQDYRNRLPEIGVYKIVNAHTNKMLLGSSLNLTSLRNKMDFARTTDTATVLDGRLSEDMRKFGIRAFTLEVLETLEVTPEMTQTQIREDLATLEQMWREKLGSDAQY